MVNITLRIVGDGDDRGRLASLAVTEGVRDQVTFLGNQSESELSREYESAWLFVLPCRYEDDPPAGEGLGLVFLDAAAAALPALIGNSAGAVDAASDQSLLIEPSVGAVADKLAFLIDGPGEYRETLGYQSRQWAVNTRSFENFEQSVFEALDSSQQVH